LCASFFCHFRLIIDKFYAAKIRIVYEIHKFSNKKLSWKEKFLKKKPASKGFGATTLLAGDYYRRYEITKVADADPWG
jgi:hypothetical protein